MVYSVSRRYHVAAQNAGPFSQWRGTKERHSADRRAVQKYAGAHLLRVGRCGCDADHFHRREISRRLRGAFERQAVPVSTCVGTGHGLSVGRQTMSELIHLTIDGRAVTAAPGTLLINAAKQVGIEVPSFCYYDGLSQPAACRMCLVKVEKTPKLQVSCTLPVSEGMVVNTDSPQVHAARKGTIEFLLTNHPLDCPVCDKGGECELQDMTFRYGMGESRFLEQKQHTDEEQWSPVVFYDKPRCILCYRCVRICDEGMGVKALGVGNRGAVSVIEPNHFDHLECDECGMCIDICPVGALTSGTYRYKTRPWEMKHVGTICTHCSDGCKTTLGVRNNEIIRGNNRDRSGINGEFLCIKGRYAADFVNSPERLQSPMLRRKGGLEPGWWSEALGAAAHKLGEVKARDGEFAVIGSHHTR